MGTPAHCTLTYGKEHVYLRPLVNFFGSKAEQWRITKIIPKIWRRETSATRAIMAISSKLRPKWFKNPPKLTEAMEEATNGDNGHDSAYQDPVGSIHVSRRMDSSADDQM